MSTPSDDRYIITANGRTTGVVLTLGEVEIAVKMPSVPGSADMTEEQMREKTLQQLRRVFEMARTEIG
jgi:predicted aspartyl protease